MTLVDLRADYAAAVAKRREILEAGEEYVISGAFNVRNPVLVDIEKTISEMGQRIARAQGYTGRTRPDFGGE